MIHPNPILNIYNYVFDDGPRVFPSVMKNRLVSEAPETV